MVDITSCSVYATTGLVYDLHHIVISVLHRIGEEHRIVSYNQEASTSHGPSIRPSVSSTPIRMQPTRGRGRGRVDRRRRGRYGGRGHGRDGEDSCGTSKPTLPTLISPPYLPITRDFYTLTNLHITFHTSRHLHIFTISSVTRASLHSSRYHLIIPPFFIPYIASHR